MEENGLQQFQFHPHYALEINEIDQNYIKNIDSKSVLIITIVEQEIGFDDNHPKFSGYFFRFDLGFQQEYYNHLHLSTAKEMMVRE